MSTAITYTAPAAGTGGTPDIPIIDAELARSTPGGSRQVVTGGGFFSCESVSSINPNFKILGSDVGGLKVTLDNWRTHHVLIPPASAKCHYPNTQNVAGAIHSYTWPWRAYVALGAWSGSGGAGGVWVLDVEPLLRGQDPVWTQVDDPAAPLHVCQAGTPRGGGQAIVCHEETTNVVWLAVATGATDDGGDGVWRIKIDMTAGAPWTITRLQLTAGVSTAGKKILSVCNTLGRARNGPSADYLVIAPYASTTLSVTTTNNVADIATAAPPAVGTPVSFLGVTPPAGFTAAETYYVRSIVAATSMQLAASPGGAAVTPLSTVTVAITPLEPLLVCANFTGATPSCAAYTGPRAPGNVTDLDFRYAPTGETAATPTLAACTGTGDVLLFDVSAAASAAWTRLAAAGTDPLITPMEQPGAAVGAVGAPSCIVATYAPQSRKMLYFVGVSGGSGRSPVIAGDSLGYRFLIGFSTSVASADWDRSARYTIFHSSDIDWRLASGIIHPNHIGGGTSQPGGSSYKVADLRVSDGELNRITVGGALVPLDIDTKGGLSKPTIRIASVPSPGGVDMCERIARGARPGEIFASSTDFILRVVRDYGAEEYLTQPAVMLGKISARATRQIFYDNDPADASIYPEGVVYVGYGNTNAATPADGAGLWGIPNAFDGTTAVKVLRLNTDYIGSVLDFKTMTDRVVHVDTKRVYLAASDDGHGVWFAAVNDASALATQNGTALTFTSQALTGLGAYAAGTPYAAGDGVTSAGITWVTRAAITGGGGPGVDLANWFPVAPFTATYGNEHGAGDLWNPTTKMAFWLDRRSGIWRAHWNGAGFDAGVRISTFATPKSIVPDGFGFMAFDPILPDRIWYTEGTGWRYIDGASVAPATLTLAGVDVWATYCPEPTTLPGAFCFAAAGHAFVFTVSENAASTPFPVRLWRVSAPIAGTWVRKDNARMRAGAAKHISDCAVDLDGETLWFTPHGQAVEILDARVGEGSG